MLEVLSINCWTGCNLVIYQEISCIMPGLEGTDIFELTKHSAK